MAQAAFGPPSDLIAPQDFALGTPLGGMGPYSGPPVDLVTPPADLMPAAQPYGVMETLARGVGERTAQLPGGLGSLASTVSSDINAWVDSVIRPYSPDVADFLRQVGPTEEGGREFATQLRKADFGYEPMTTWEDIKKAPLTNVIPFALEQGIVSIPDMIGVMTSLPAYIAARTGEIGEQRAANDERSKATIGDFVAAAPAAVVSALLERLGTSKIIGVDEVIKAFKEIPKQAGKAALTEAATEAGQEGVEYLGEQAGTKKGVTFSEGAERMLAAAVGGGPFGGAVRGVTGAAQAFGEWRGKQPGSPPADIDPTQEEVSAFANSPEAHRAAANVRKMQGPAADEPPPPPPGGGAPAPGEAVGLTFPGAPSRRATIQQYFDDGDSVRVIFDDGSKTDLLTEDLLRDRTEAPPPMSESVRGPEGSEGALSEAEALARFDEVPPQPSATRKAPAQPRLGAEAINALDQAKELERVALSSTNMPAPQRTALLIQAALLRQTYGAPAEPAAETPRAVPPPTELATTLGPLGSAAAGNAPRRKAPVQPSAPAVQKTTTPNGIPEFLIRRPAVAAVEPADVRPPQSFEDLPPIVEAPDEYASAVKGRPEPPLLATPNAPPAAGVPKVDTPVQGEGAREMARIVREADEALAPQIIKERRAVERETPKPTQIMREVMQPRAIRRADLLDAKGEVNMGEAGATLARAAQEALNAGETVTLWQEGKPIPIVNVERGMIQDAKGQRWGAMGVLAPKRGDDDRLEITPARAPQAQSQENVSERSAPEQIEDTGVTRVQTPQISKAAAKQALRTNIDPRTGKRPQTKVALKQLRQEMRSIMTGKPIVKRAAPTVSAERTDISLQQAIKSLGGIRVRDGKGNVTKEGQDVVEALGGNFLVGVLNSKGKDPVQMLSALRQLDWFGPRADQGIDMDELYDALRAGKAFRHPLSQPQAERSETPAPADRMEELQYRAREMRLQLPEDATEEELDAAIAEREAMAEEAGEEIANERELEAKARFDELLKTSDPLDAWSQAYDASAEEVSAEPRVPDQAEEERARPGPEPPDQTQPPRAGAEAAGSREDAVPPAKQEAKEEPGALDERGRALPQKIIPGAERSEERSDAARRSAQQVRQKQELELRAKQQKMRRGGQESAGGMFAAERDQTDIFAPGSKQAPIALETKADVKEMNAAPVAEPKSAEQAEAGNYQKVHAVIKELPIALENRKGDMRRSKPGAKVTWAVKMRVAYGYFKKSEGYDGDEVDVFVGDNPDSNAAFIIYQKDLETGEFDEHKVMLAFNSVTEARQAYIDSFSDGKGMQRIINIQQLSVDNLKKRLSGGFFRTKPRDVEAKIAEVANKAGFRRQVTRLNQLVRSRLAKAKRIFDRDNRVTATMNSRPDVRHVLTRSSDEGVAFRVTTIDKDGPSGHRNYNTFEDAVRQEFGGAFTMQDKGNESLPNVTETPAAPFTFESFAQEEAKLRQGDMTAAEAMANFERVFASEGRLKAELRAMTKPQLAKMDPRNRNMSKEVLVSSIYSDMLNSFNASGVYSWSMGKGSAIDGIRKAMEKQTDADIKEAAEKRKQRGKEMVQTYTDPQTLSQFQSFIQMRGIDKLTPAQKERYDSLVADQTKNDQARENAAAQIVKKVDVETTMSDIIETKHTTKGHDLFVVQLSDRVPKEQYQALASAGKKLGGYYSSFRGKGAVPGFQFKTREAAEKFRQLREGDVSKADITEKREEAKTERAVESLRDMADNLEAAADDKMNADRKTNTVKRAREAASAELDAAQDKALAITMRNIADGIDAGDVRYLDRIKTKSAIEQLESLVRNARSWWATAQQKKTNERYETLTGTPINSEMIGYARYPWPSTHRENLAKLGRFFQGKKGMMRISNAALKIAAEMQAKDQWQFRAEGLADQEMLSVLAKAGLREPDLKYESQAILETFKEYGRVVNLGFSNEPTLRAALREFLEYRGSAPAQDPIKAAKRALVGLKIPGYFPTPPRVVDRMIDLAQIRPGMSVLEPEAGTGHIADRVRDEGVRMAEEGGKLISLDVIEQQSSLQDILKMKNYRVVGDNMLEHEGQYDRIVMNPPFENGQDMDHVRHAYDLLAPGGRLVAVMSEGPFGRSDAKSEDFRQWLDVVGGTTERLPEGSFKESDRSTGVATRIVTVIKSVKSAVTTFLQSESGTVGNQRGPGDDFNDDVADAMAEDNRSVPVGTYARALSRTQSGEGAEATIGYTGSHIIEPRSLARKDFRSARYWNAIKAEDHEGSANINSYRELVRPYLELPEASRAKVNAVLELDRLENRTRKDDGRRVVVRNENQEEAELSKPGQSVKLTKAETAGLHAARRMFAKQWNDLIRGTARKFGWDGEPSSAAIKKEAEGLSAREAKDLLRIASLLQALEEQERAGYVPLMRHGDYYIAVKRVGDEESLGGFPRVARFERLETSPGWEQLFGSVPGLSSKNKAGVPKVVAKRLAELEAKYPKSEGFEIEHGNVARNVEALRSLDIPAVEKLLIALDLRGGGEIKSAMIDKLRDQLYEELKAGFKKRARTIPGYDPNFSRSIGSYSHWIAYHVAQLIHGDRVQAAYDETQKHPSFWVRDFWQTWKQDDDKPIHVGDKVLRGLTSAAFYYTMAANPSSALVTFDAPLAAHATLSVGLGPAKTGGIFTKALKDGTAALRANTSEGIHVDIEAMARTAEERAFLKKMLEDGELGRTQELATDFGALTDHQAQIFGEYRSQAKKALDISTSAFLAANEMSRAVTALTAFRLARNPENFAKMDSAWSKNEVYRDMVRSFGRSPETIARFLTTEAAFEWGRKNRAKWLGRHALGSVVWQFKQFPIKFLSVTKNLMFNMGAPGKAAAAMLMASLWAYAGVQGLYFLQDFEKLFDWMWTQLTGEDPQMRASMYRLLDNAGLGKVGADIVLRGPLSVLFGADVSNRFGFGDLVSQNQSAVDFLGAGPSMLYQAVSGASRRYASGQSTAAVVAQLAPAGVRNPLQALGVYPDEGIKTQTGTTMIRPEQVTVADQVRRGLGFQPLKVSRAYDKMEYERRTRDASDVRVSRVYTQLTNLVQQRDEAQANKDGVAYMRISKQINDVIDANAELGLTRRNVRMRLLQRQDPSAAAIKLAPRRAREDMLNNPFPAP